MLYATDDLGFFLLISQDVVKDPCSDEFIDRLYCCHLFHRGCFDAYMKKPPFAGELYLVAFCNGIKVNTDVSSGSFCS